MPSQTTFESRGSTTTQPSENEPPLVEDWRPRVAAVVGLPQPAAAGRDVPDARVLRVHLDVRHAAGRQARADAAEREARQDVGVEPIAGRLRLHAEDCRNADESHCGQ